MTSLQGANELTTTESLVWLRAVLALAKFQPVSFPSLPHLDATGRARAVYAGCV